MKTSVVGYPRIGASRELKFASEKYFKKEITLEELKETAARLRKTHWEIQKNTASIISRPTIFRFMIICWTQQRC